VRTDEQGALNYDIKAALTRSGDFKGLIEVLAEDLSRGLKASLKIEDDKAKAILFISLNGAELKNETAAFSIMISFERFGKLKLYRPLALSQEEIHYGELVSSYLTLAYLGLNNSGLKSVDIKASLSSLSYSELEAVIQVISELEGDEGLLIASKIAKQQGLSRSGIVNGLKKLESAALIETRSLGMKGTYIKILNEALVTELKKFIVRRP